MKERRRQTRHLGIVLENYTTFIAHFQELPFYTLSVVRKSLLAGGDFDILPAEKSAIGEQLLARSVRSNVQGSVRKNDSLPDGRLTRLQLYPLNLTAKSGNTLHLSLSTPPPSHFQRFFLWEAAENFCAENCTGPWTCFSGL